MVLQGCCQPTSAVGNLLGSNVLQITAFEFRVSSSTQWFFKRLSRMYIFFLHLQVAGCFEHDGVFKDTDFRLGFWGPGMELPPAWPRGRGRGPAGKQLLLDMPWVQRKLPGAIQRHFCLSGCPVSMVLVPPGVVPCSWKPVGRCPPSLCSQCPALQWLLAAGWGNNPANHVAPSAAL